MKKILFAASEAVPFCKTGGLADVVGSLPKYFDKKKYDVRIMIPKYMCIDDKWKQNMTFQTHFYVQLGWRKQYVGIWEAEYDGIHYNLLQNQKTLFVLIMSFILPVVSHMAKFIRILRNLLSFPKQC